MTVILERDDGAAPDPLYAPTPVRELTRAERQRLIASTPRLTQR
jgi:hypothetical protein